MKLRQDNANERIWEAQKHPGGMALLRAWRLRDGEGAVRAELATTTDPSRRVLLEAQANELHRLAGIEEQEGRALIMKNEGTRIRSEMRHRLANIAGRLALVKEADDPQYPEDHRLTRRQQREVLIREWKTVEERGFGELRQWAETARAEATALYESEPIGDAAAESRRVANELEIARIAAPLIGQSGTLIKNRLLGEARRYLALNMPDKARIQLEAARRAGVEDGRLDQALSEAYDRTVPTRKQGREQLQAIQDEQDLYDVDRYNLRIAHNVGDAVRNSNAAKLLAYQRGQGTPAGLMTTAVEVGAGTGSGSGDGGNGTGDGGSASE